MTSIPPGLPMPPPGAQANRTDLVAPPPPGPQPAGQPNGQPGKVPIMAPTGLPYGEHQSLINAQQQVPMGSGAPGLPAPSQTGNPIQDARQMEYPALGPLRGPTERPNEHVTTGLPGGPPPQAGSLPPPQNQPGGISGMLIKMSAMTGSAALSQLAAAAQKQGQ